MPSLPSRILQLLKNAPGLSDREIADTLLGTDAPQQPVNQACRSLERRSKIKRLKRTDGRFGNYLANHEIVASSESSQRISQNSVELSEDVVKQCLKEWLSEQGWITRIAWGNTRGIDVEAFRDGERWIIEAKGQGSSDQERGNYFLAMLGEMLQRMSDPSAKYSIALPDIQQFRNLWAKLPRLAKSRTQITALFVDSQGRVDEVM